MGFYFANLCVSCFYPLTFSQVHIPKQEDLQSSFPSVFFPSLGHLCHYGLCPESWKKHSHTDRAALVLPPSLHQRGFTIDRLSDHFVSIIFLFVDQFHCFHSSPMSTGHFSKPCSFSLPPLLSYAYFHFILELSYFCCAENLCTC